MFYKLTLISFSVITIAFISCKQNFSDEDYDKAYKVKMAFAEAILGKSDTMVGHAIIPFQIGGTVDMYYFPMLFLEPDSQRWS